MLKLFKFLIQWADSSEEAMFTQTKTGEYVRYYGGPSAHDVSKPVGKGYEPAQASIERWAAHSHGENRGHNHRNG